MLTLRSVRVAVAAPLLAGVLAFPAAVQAQLVSPSPWGAGLGVSLKRQAHDGLAFDPAGVPLITGDSGWLQFAGPAADLRLTTVGPVALGLRARHAVDGGYRAGGAPGLGGSAESRPGLWLGAAALWRSGMADLSAEWLADASGRSDGQRLRLMAERSFTQGPFQLAPRLALHWHDARSVAGYPRAQAGDAAGAGTRLRGRSAVNTELGLRTSYALTASQGLYLDLSAMRLGAGIQDSLLVDRSTDAAVRLGYQYRF